LAYTNAENQRRFKERMYNAGFKQVQIWMQRKPEQNRLKMDRASFIVKLDKLTAGWTETTLSRLFILLIKIVEAKKEVARLRGNKEA
jgi:hypothetical protein